MPGCNFLPIASLACLPYWIGGMVPYTKGNIVHTVIIASIWIAIAMLIASNVAPIGTKLCLDTGLFVDQIKNGAMFASWDEGGNILMWILIKICSFFGLAA